MGEERTCTTVRMQVGFTYSNREQLLHKQRRLLVRDLLSWEYTGPLYHQYKKQKSDK